MYYNKYMNKKIGLEGREVLAALAKYLQVDARDLEAALIDIAEKKGQRKEGR